MAKPHPKPPKKVECIRAPVGKQHINKCKEGFGFAGPPGKENQHIGPAKPKSVEVHHIFCVEAASDSKIPSGTDMDYLEACFKLTPWNINETHNTIGLPRKWAYVRDKDGSKTGWDGYACHMVDHDRYLKQVITWLGENVWSNLDKAQKNKKCEIINGKNLTTKLESCTNKFKPGLKSRKTKLAMDYCHGVPKTGFTDATWFKEFSMWKAQARRRAKIKKAVGRKELLDEIKKKIK